MIIISNIKKVSKNAIRRQYRHKIFWLNERQDDAHILKRLMGNIKARICPLERNREQEGLRRYRLRQRKMRSRQIIFAFTEKHQV